MLHSVLQLNIGFQALISPLKISPRLCWMNYLAIVLACVGRWNLTCHGGPCIASVGNNVFHRLPLSPRHVAEAAAYLPRRRRAAALPSSAFPGPASSSTTRWRTEDIERRVREALRVIWGERADAIEAEACQILGVRTLRDYFRKPTASSPTISSATPRAAARRPSTGRSPRRPAPTRSGSTTTA